MYKFFSFSLIFSLLTIACKGQKQSFASAALTEKLVAFNGNLISFEDVLKKHSGKTIVIDVWASWCKDCVKAMPKTNELQAANPDVNFIFISMDKTEDKWKEGIDKHNLKGDHYMTTDGMKGVFGKAIDLDWIPRYIIVNKTGKIEIYRAIETDFEKISQTLKNIK